MWRHQPRLTSFEYEATAKAANVAHKHSTVLVATPIALTITWMNERERERNRARDTQHTITKRNTALTKRKLNGKAPKYLTSVIHIYYT